MVGGLLGLYLRNRVLAHPIQEFPRLVERPLNGRQDRREGVSLHLLCRGAIGRGEPLANVLVIADKCLIGLRRNLARENLDVIYAERRIAADKVAIEKAEGTSRFDRFDPERDLRKLDRERIDVRAVDAVPHHLTERRLVGGWR